LAIHVREETRVLRLTTFFSQGTFVLPLAGLPGSFIFMADRWNPSDLRDSRYVWLPLKVGGLADEPMDYSFGFQLWSRVSIFWHKRWRMEEHKLNLNLFLKPEILWMVTKRMLHPETLLILGNVYWIRERGTVKKRLN
jgi:hypothetical protein